MNCPSPGTPPASSSPDIVTLPSAAEVARHAASLVADVVHATPDANLILPAGATPVPIYRDLIRRTVMEGLDLSRAHVFQLDELEGVAPDDQRSFHAFLRRSLLDELIRDPKADHLLDGTKSNTADEILQHALTLQERGGPHLTLLGLGLNGHVGYNEPGTRAEDEARRVDLDDSTRHGLRNAFRSGRVPKRGITLGLRELLSSQRIGVVVFGEAKADILRRTLTEPPSSDLPASFLRSHQAITWIVDEAAASAL